MQAEVRQFKSSCASNSKGAYDTPETHVLRVLLCIRYNPNPNPITVRHLLCAIADGILLKKGGEVDVDGLAMP
eukprot:8838933-Pyramimonas_sp.AAC.2